MDEAIAELRALAEALLGRVDPWLRSGAEAAAEPSAGNPDCGWCPLCALAAVLRGQRPELARRLAEQGVGWVSAVRAVLAAHDQRCAADAAVPAEPAAPRRVQHITVRTGGAHR